MSVLLFGAPTARAQDEQQVSLRQEDLKELRERIASLNQELSASESSHSDASDQLRQSERQISESERKLFDLKKDRTRLTQTLSGLSRQSRDLEDILSKQQAQLGNLFYQQYLRSAPNPLQLMLNGGNPNQLSRDFHYLTAIARARQTLLAETRETLQRQQALAAQTQTHASEISSVEAAQQSEYRTLLKQKAERQKVLTRITDRIRAQKREIGALRKDEQRLTQLIERLTRLLAEQEAKQRGRTKSAENASSAEDSAPGENLFLPTASSDAFTRQKGRLRLPARGRIVGRFGAAREGNDAWKGLYIRAPEGSEVKAIANGLVVYAEWMRGFGNLMIIDHGAGYLTVYGNNHSLLKQVGEKVEGGETVGTVGRSGGEEDFGLYFELRHQGLALDPMQWVSLK